MKRIIAIVFSVLFLLTGCFSPISLAGTVYFFNQPMSLPLHQAKTDVSQIELCLFSYTNYTLTPLVMLEDDDALKFWDELQQVECTKHVTDPHWEYGQFAIRVIYHDGCIDTLSTELCSYSCDGDEVVYDRYDLDHDDMRELFSRYVDPKLLP